MADKTKPDIVKEVSKRTGISKTDCGAVYDVVMATIRDMVVEGDTIMIEGLGVFRQRKGVSHTLKNIHTGERFKTDPVPTPIFIINIALRKEYSDRWAKGQKK
jgi:nucleoid DNA-binding protein